MTFSRLRIIVDPCTLPCATPSETRDLRPQPFKLVSRHHNAYLSTLVYRILERQQVNAASPSILLPSIPSTRSFKYAKLTVVGTHWHLRADVIGSGVTGLAAPWVRFCSLSYQADSRRARFPLRRKYTIQHLIHHAHSV
jgi:hypothetical protein